MSTEQTTFMISDRCITAARHRRNRSGWKLECAVAERVDAPSALIPDTDLSIYVEPVVRLAHEIGADATVARILIPGTWVFAHRVARPGRRLDTAAAAFELEGYLPLPLEDLTCIFVPTGDDDLLGLAVATQPLRHLLDQLSEHAIHIDSIEIDALAAVGADTFGTLWVDRHHVSILVTDDNQRVRDWRTARVASPEKMADELAAFASATSHQPDAWRVLGYAPNDAINDNDASDPHDGTPIPLPARGLRGADLRVGPLALGGRWDQTLHRAARCVAMLAVVLALTAAGFHRQRATADRALTDLANTECRLYSEAFPRRPCPPGIAMRVASERIRLEGLTRGTTDADVEGTIANSTPLLATLRDLVAAVPTDVRLFVQDLRLDEKHLSLRGTAKTHTESERIAKAIKTVAGLTPSPPRSDARREGGVTFSLHAKRGPHDLVRQTTAR